LGAIDTMWVFSSRAATLSSLSTGSSFYLY
jgi:hypothetical protein